MIRKWIVLGVISFIAIVNSGKADMEYNIEKLGCEVIGEWNGGKRYLFLHCPDEAMGEVSGSDGYWIPKEAIE